MPKRATTAGGVDSPPAALGDLDIATPAMDFRRVREQGELVMLPSTGRMVRMRVVKPANLLRLGTIPDSLSELVISVLYGTITPEQYEQFFSVVDRKEQAVHLAESLRVVCTAALLEPRIVDDPQADDEIHIDDLEDGEQRHIFDFALLEATRLSRFRARQVAALEAVAQGQEPEPAPQPVA